MKGTVAFLFFLLFLAGYALVSLRGGGAGPGSSAGEGGDDELTQTRWEIRTAGEVAAVAESGVFVEFGEGNRLSGNGGCNFFSGAYERDAGSFRVSSLRATRRACEPDVMGLEQRLFDALGSARSAVLEGSELRIRDDAGVILLVLVKAS